ncbi:MAG: beta-glucosidase/6-phospho-beta-glucosidase/beta -galactosidase [Pedosphaera sp.]|nr:beta-glucosidase/6-phospho-beta-glucosidase/beta -galactosidase [Pedosphaera sp.]
MKTQNPYPSADAIPGRSNFKSYFMAGFECSSHQLRSGRRLDMINATRHDTFALQDYARIKDHGMRTAREGVRWHLVEPTPGSYDFASVLPIARAAEATETQVIWDLCHFGWPEDIDIFKPEFVTRLANFGAAFAQFLQTETNLGPYFVPVNEISFFSWAGGEEGGLNPHATGRGFELKCQLVRASIAAMKAIWAVNSRARFVHVDPIIHVVAHPKRPQERAQAEAYRLSQFQSWDMLGGRLWPELGGAEKYLDIIGVNFYFHNQWIYDIKGFRRSHEFEPLRRTDPLYRPLREILAEVYERYHRPMFMAETGAENEARADWLRYVGNETEAAIRQGVPVDGICLYPILNHPGWNDGRHCHNGLWDYADKNGNREIYQPLAAQLRRCQKVFESLVPPPVELAKQPAHNGKKHRSRRSGPVKLTKAHRATVNQ